VDPFEEGRTHNILFSTYGSQDIQAAFCSKSLKTEDVLYVQNVPTGEAIALSAGPSSEEKFLIAWRIVLDAPM
jgi:hypothetical protein